MQVWKIPPSVGDRVAATASVRPPTEAGSSASCAATVASLVDCIARADFGLRALNRLNSALPVAWWSVYKVYSEQPPTLCTLGSYDVPDIALDCFRTYRTGPYRHDAAFLQARDQARSAAAGHAVLAHCVADDFGAVHREQIYQRHSLSERLSVVSSEPVGDEPGGRGKGELLAINLYRHRAQPRFSMAEIDAVFEMAGPMMAVVRRHLELLPHRHGPSHPLPQIGRAAPEFGLRLRQLCADLTDRELEVCERLLRGWTFEGIAADLRLSTPTVKTYRNRAFARLDIHHRNQLFGLVLGGEAQACGE